MLSTSKLMDFSINQSKQNEKLYKKQKFTHQMISPYQHHKNQVNSNTYQIKKKFPTVEIDHIKSLLEQLENDVDMVCDILEQQHKKLTNKKLLRGSMQSQKIQAQLGLIDQRKDKAEPPKPSEMATLKSSLIKLYKMLESEKKQKQQLSKKVSVLSKQNQNLKLMNQQLLNQSMTQMDFIKDLNIC